jgi:hypothetical protein
MQPRDQMLEPPVSPLTTPIYPPDATTEEADIAALFNHGLPQDGSTLVRYRQSSKPGNEIFLCHWYAYARLEGLLQRGKEYPKGTGWIQDDLTQETSETFRGLLEEHLQLVPCDDTDPNRVRI